MARYLQLAKYSPQACAAVFNDGWVARRKVLEEYVNGLGGRIVDMHVVANDDWDFMAILDFDDLGPAKFAAHLTRVYGGGAIERAQFIPLAGLEEVDAARSSLPGYTPPWQ